MVTRTATKKSITPATRKPAPTASAPTRPLHMIIYNRYSSLVGWPSMIRGGDGYAIETRDFIVPNLTEQEDLKVNWHFQGLLDEGKLEVQYLERIPKRGEDEPAGFSRLNSSMKNDILEIVYGDDFNFNHKSSVMPMTIGGTLDTHWIDTYYRPMLQMARNYLRSAKVPKADMRIQAIDAHLLKLKNVNL